MVGTEITAAAAVLASIKTATDLLRLARDVRDDHKFEERLTEVRRLLGEAYSHSLSVQEQHFSVLDENKKLEAQIASMEEWLAEKVKYDLHQPAPGVFTRIRKEGAEPIEPVHQICTQCYDRGEKTILQRVVRNPGRVETLVCPAGHPDLILSGYTPPPPTPPRKSRPSTFLTTSRYPNRY